MQWLQRLAPNGGCPGAVAAKASFKRRLEGGGLQTNILWDQLTVWEHFLLYAAIKGIPGGAWGARAKSSAEEMVQVG